MSTPTPFWVVQELTQAWPIWRTVNLLGFPFTSYLCPYPGERLQQLTDTPDRLNVKCTLLGLWAFKHCPR